MAKWLETKITCQVDVLYFGPGGCIIVFIKSEMIGGRRHRFFPTFVLAQFPWGFVTHHEYPGVVGGPPTLNSRADTSHPLPESLAGDD